MQHLAVPSKMKSTLLLIAALLAATPALPPAVADAPAEASQLFQKNCANCHGKDGRARTFRARFNKARDLTDAQWQEATADPLITESIRAGRGKMPPFATVLTDSQIALLTQYVRGLKQPSAVVSPVSQPPSEAGQLQGSDP